MLICFRMGRPLLCKPKRTQRAVRWLPGLEKHVPSDDVLVSSWMKLTTVTIEHILTEGDGLRLEWMTLPDEVHGRRRA